MSSFRLDGKRALITGASKGIGLGIADAYARAGADVVLLARNQETLAAASDQVGSHGTQVDTISFDLRQTGDIAATYERILTTCGDVDILVNNAGINRRGSAEALDLTEWKEIMGVNLDAVFAFSKAFAQDCIAQEKPGRILNIASLMSVQTRPGVSAYTASKGGVKQLTQALAVDWAPYGILVNAIGPGYIETPLNEPLVTDPTFDAWVKERCPLGRWGTPEDIALPAVFLVSDAARFITGQTIYVDGGWLSRF